MLSRRGFFKGLLGLGAVLASRCVPAPQLAMGGSQAVRQRIVNPPIAGSSPALPATPKVIGVDWGRTPSFGVYTLTNGGNAPVYVGEDCILPGEMRTYQIPEFRGEGRRVEW